MAGIRKKLKAIKKRLRRMVSKTPKRKFYYGFFQNTAVCVPSGC